jgi:integrase
MGLTVKRVAKLIRRGVPGRHLDGGSNGVKGLYLCVASKTAAHYELRFQLEHRVRWMGLGAARTFSLDEARQRARDARKVLADKIDPLENRRAERAKQAAATASRKTFKEVAEDFVTDKRREWRSAKHGRQWLTSLQTYAFPIIGAVDVSQIDKPAILRVLEQKVPASPGHEAGKFWLIKTVTADRVRSRIELVLNYAKVRGHRTRDNPAAWADLKHVLPKPTKVAVVNHHAAVPYADVPVLVGELRRHQGVGVQAMEFLILTAARLGEVTGVTWDEIDLNEKVWTLPAARMKSNREHKVPLALQAVALLQSLPTEQDNPYLFIGAHKQMISADALTMVLKRMKRSETIHGFRSSFSDWAHERSAFNNQVIELSLAHSVGSAAEQAYRRGEMMDKRRKLMEVWATYCTTAPIVSAEVVPLRGEGRS